MVYFLLVVLGILAFITMCMTLVITGEKTAKVVQQLGKFVRVSSPGLSFKWPWIDWASRPISLRVQQLVVDVETKTLDNVFVTVKVSVQYFVLQAKIYDAFFRLQDPKQQITSYVFDVVRARVPKIKLDDVFEKKDEIADAVRSELTNTMDDFGYGIEKALVTDIDPDAKVKASMNEINAAQRLRVAASEKGEADKILMIKAAEADAESKRLQGEGIANQRKAIIAGLQESVDLFQKSVPGSTPQDVMSLVMMTQYFDTLAEIGGDGKVVFLPHSPAGLSDLATQIRNAIMTGNEAITSRSEAVAERDK